METESSHKELAQLMRQNSELIKENNKLLKKIHRNALWSFWVRVAWYSILVGLPFALYFYVLQPYFDALGSDYEAFRAGIREIPGLKNLNNFLEGGG